MEFGFDRACMTGNWLRCVYLGVEIAYWELSPFKLPCSVEKQGKGGDDNGDESGRRGSDVGY
jgi:hypothetical protein